MLARVTEVVRRRFGVEYTLAGMDLLLHRIGWSVQVPAWRAAERDEAAIAAWREETWPVVKARRRTWAAGSVRPNQVKQARGTKRGGLCRPFCGHLPVEQRPGRPGPPRRALHLIVFFRQHVADQGMDADQREQLVKPRPSDYSIENAGLPSATIATISTVLRRGAVGVGRTSVMGSGC
jgi:hypothetical protein